MRVLGVDPSLRSTGYAVVDGDRKKQSVLEYGLIKTTSAEQLEDSLEKIADTIEDVVNKYQPDCLAIEDLFTHKNSKVALQLGHVRGVIMLICRRLGLPAAQYPATRIKETISGYGRASKEQMQTMVTRSLSLTEEPPSDAADALAAALTHLIWEGSPGGSK
jgi:crossover junction endodeoxyribonuclease RuvC